MTGITADQHRAERVLRAAQLAIALAIGVVGGSMTTLGLLGTQAAPAQEAPGAPAAITPVDQSTTTASRQYADWYTRDQEASAAGTTTASRQYADWYTRGELARAGSTSATEQYVSWFTRPAGSR